MSVTFSRLLGILVFLSGTTCLSQAFDIHNTRRTFLFGVANGAPGASDNAVVADPPEVHTAETQPIIMSSSMAEVPTATDEDGPDSVLGVDRHLLYHPDGTRDLSRREWLRLSTVMASTAIIGGVAIQKNLPENTRTRFSKAFRPLNVTQIFEETSINITVQGPPFTWVALDPTTFQKKQTLQLPGWIPTALVPPSRVMRDVSNAELLTAAIAAGSIVEMGRTCLLYPLATLKTRVQSDINTRRKKYKSLPLRLSTRLKLTLLKAKQHWNEGNLYAGVLPTLFIAAPTTGLYYGVRDVAKRSLVHLAPNADIGIALGAAFLGDVVALAFRTPIDTLSVRLQASTATLAQEAKRRQEANETLSKQEQEELLRAKVGNWAWESVERLPAVILTDLPYLLSRIALNRIILQQHVNVGRYELVVIGISILCSLLTTPFDVARTRILINSDDDPENGINGGSGEGLVRTFRTIANEGDGGIRNLFAGWLERTAYLGIGRAGLEPLQIIAYIAIRDAILLGWFD